MRIFLKTEDEIQFLRTASHIASCALSEVGRNVVPLSSVGYLKAKATDIVVQLVSSKTQSIRNEQSFHIDLSFFLNGTYNDDFAGDSTLSKGDLLSVNCSTCYKGYYSFAASTFIVGGILDDHPFLTWVRDGLIRAQAKAVAGHPISEISHAFLSAMQEDTFNLCDCIGHGIGRYKQEFPIMRLSSALSGRRLLKEGMTLVIAPTIMSTTVRSRCSTMNHDDGHHNSFVPFGSTVVVRTGRSEILTSLETLS